MERCGLGRNSSKSEKHADHEGWARSRRTCLRITPSCFLIASGCHASRILKGVLWGEFQVVSRSAALLRIDVSNVRVELIRLVRIGPWRASMRHRRIVCFRRTEQSWMSSLRVGEEMAIQHQVQSRKGTFQRAGKILEVYG